MPSKLDKAKEKFNGLRAKEEKELERVERKNKERHEKYLARESQAEIKTKMKLRKISERYDQLLADARAEYNKASGEEVYRTKPKKPLRMGNRGLGAYFSTKK